MANVALLLPTGRARVVLDLVLVAWVAGWIFLGVAIGNQVSGLKQLSSTVTQVGVAVKETGNTVSTLGSLPFVGGRVSDTARQIQRAGDSAIASGRQSQNSVHELSWMLALAIAVIPSVPVLGFYLPMRIADMRERRTLSRLVHEHWEEPEFRRRLAERALATIPYRRLVRISSDPWGDVAADRCEALAAAELDRLGVAVKPWHAPVR